MGRVAHCYFKVFYTSTSKKYLTQEGTQVKVEKYLEKMKLVL